MKCFVLWVDNEEFNTWHDQVKITLGLAENVSFSKFHQHPKPTDNRGYSVVDQNQVNVTSLNVVVQQDLVDLGFFRDTSIIDEKIEKGREVIVNFLKENYFDDMTAPQSAWAWHRLRKCIIPGNSVCPFGGQVIQNQIDLNIVDCLTWNSLEIAAWALCYMPVDDMTAPEHFFTKEVIDKFLDKILKLLAEEIWPASGIPQPTIDLMITAAWQIVGQVRP